MVDASNIRLGGPLADHREALWQALLARGYTPLSAANLVRLAAHLSRWLEGRGLRAEELSTQHGAAFLDARRAAGYTQFLTARALAPILRYLEENGILSPVAPEPSHTSEADQLLDTYSRYLLGERRLVLHSVQRYELIARQFLRWRFGEQPVEWAAVTAHDTVSFVLETSRRYSVGTAKYIVTALRSLLRFLFLEEKIASDLRGAVPAVASWRLVGLPKALDAKQVQRLLRACDRRRHLGRRDYAVLLLMVRMGLRAGEVAAVELDDIDWRCGDMLVHGKGQRDERLPLPADVGAALAHYLRFSRRHTASRRLFLCARAPHAPLTAGAVTAMTRRASWRAGLSPIGAHRLRHTAATQILRAGGSLDEIAQVLRHRSHDTTAIYAKVDRTALRALAWPWPGDAS